ncbi:hypothetical protein [Archangium sp.]|uniref:hypothetical protein n=1 Tax=Archangium sp. TaxID=1872627 RepID=UPI00389B07A2
MRKVGAKRARTLLGETGVRTALLAVNPSWASFVPVGVGEPDLGRLAVQARAHVLTVWFDEDSAVTLQVNGPEGQWTELYLPLYEAEGPGAEDERLFEEWVGHKLLSARSAAELRRRLAAPPKQRREWLREHGVERLLKLAFVPPIPLGWELEALRQLAPGLELVEAEAPAPAAQPAVAPSPGAPRKLSPRQQATLSLHLHYLTTLWNMNNWKLYTRYKRHLPAPRRAEVDDLVSALVEREASDEELQGRLEAILADTWEAEDWDAFIRNPKLLENEVPSEEQLDDWQRRLAETR